VILGHARNTASDLATRRRVGEIVFRKDRSSRIALLLVGGIVYITTQVWGDLSVIHNVSLFPYLLLGLALVIALGFEFVNGFHDTANAVATVIYTNSLAPHTAVVYSGS